MVLKIVYPPIKHLSMHLLRYIINVNVQNSALIFNPIVHFNFHLWPLTLDLSSRSKSSRHTEYDSGASSGEAMKRFGNSKGFSSDQYFNRDKETDVSVFFCNSSNFFFNYYSNNVYLDVSDLVMPVWIQPE